VSLPSTPDQPRNQKLAFFRMGRAARRIDVEKSAYHHLSHFEISEETRARLSARSPTLVCRRTDARRAFAGGRHIAQFRVTHKASVVIGIVLQRDLHRVAAVFKPQLEGFVGH
jgi:hypothetical protein